MKKRSVARIAILIVICAATCLLITLYAAFSLTPDIAMLTKYIEKNADDLIYIAQKYPDQYVCVNAYGVETMDARNDDICYSFSWSRNMPEGGSYIYYADDGILTTLDHSFTSDTYVDCLGINGDGYIKCMKLLHNWFLIEYCLPT